MAEEKHDVYLSKVMETINSIFDLNARIDERVQTLMTKQKEVERKIEEFSNISSRVKILEDKEINTNNYLIKQLDEIKSKIHSIESDVTNQIFKKIEEIKENIHQIQMKIQKLEGSTEGQENRWKTIASFTLQFIWVILAAYVLYKLGIQAPAVP